MSIHWIVAEHDVLASTQDTLKEAASAQPEGYAVQAARQSAGRGRHGRTWESPEGNLYISVLLKPGCAAAQAGQIAFVAGLAVAGAIEDCGGGDLFLKWPNDVFLGGRKCAGTLIETSIRDGQVEWLALGIGVNLTSAPEEGSALQDFSSRPVPPEIFRDVLLSRIDEYYGLWRAEGFEPVRVAWLEKAHKKDTQITVKTAQEAVQGAFHDVDGEGNLLIRDAGRNIRTISAGDVLLTGT